MTRSEPPPLTPDEQAQSARVAARLRAELDAAGGWLPFARWMELALYAPGLGYYSAGARKFGVDGDFVTAPEISPVFGRCIAAQCAEVLATLGGGDLVEYGAGSGRLAAELLGELARLGRLPERYAIVDVSADLRDRQRAQLAALPAALRARVQWLDAPPDADWRGVVLANELLDALPVERFRRRAHGVERLGVAVAAGDPLRFATAARPADAPLARAVAALEAARGAPLPDGYVSECCLLLDGWLAAATARMTAGVALLFDYGTNRADYYSTERAGGTLAAHYRHRRLDDPYARPGLQDLTAWVDFTHAAEAGLAAGLEVAGYTTQAHFLLGTGFERQVATLVEAAGPGDGALAARAAARLVLPGELGERFKCLALAREFRDPLRGFALRDFAAAL